MKRRITLTQFLEKDTRPHWKSILGALLVFVAFPAVVGLIIALVAQAVTP